MKEYAKKFYKSRKWQRVRKLYLESINFTCERCEELACIVHHKIYINENNINDNDITLNFKNLEGLCQECHNKEHHEKYSSTRYELKFTPDGDIVKR